MARDAMGAAIIRLERAGDRIVARKGTSKAARVAAKDRNGAVGDPWAPVHKTLNKSLTLSERDFDYRLLSDLLFSGDWVLPLLARPAAQEPASTRFLLVAAALARGNSKTEGFKRRALPLNGRIAQAMADAQGRLRLEELARQQIEEVKKFSIALRIALAIVAASGEVKRKKDGGFEPPKKEHYAHADAAGRQFDRAADGLFFRHLWDRFEAQATDREAACHAAFARDLWAVLWTQFEAALPSIPCHARFRPRAEARARSRLRSGYGLRTHFPTLFETPAGKGTPDADDADANHAEAEHADLDHADA